MILTQHLEEISQETFENKGVFAYVSSENPEKTFFPRNKIINLFPQLYDNELVIDMKVGNSYPTLKSPKLFALCLFEKNEELKDNKAYLNAAYLEFSIKSLLPQFGKGQIINLIFNKSFVHGSNWIVIKNIIERHLSDKEVHILIIRD